MGYLHTLLDYWKSPKGKHDVLDYIRAIIIIGAVAALIRITAEML